MSDSAWRQAPREGSSTATHDLELELELKLVTLACDDQDACLRSSMLARCCVTTTNTAGEGVVICMDC